MTSTKSQECMQVERTYQYQEVVCQSQASRTQSQLKLVIHNQRYVRIMQNQQYQLINQLLQLKLPLIQIKTYHPLSIQGIKLPLIDLYFHSLYCKTHQMNLIKPPTHVIKKKTTKLQQTIAIKNLRSMRLLILALGALPCNEHHHSLRSRQLPKLYHQTLQAI